jgi:hypothetical protein
MRGLGDGLPNMGHGLTWLFGMIVIVGPDQFELERSGKSRSATSNNTHNITVAHRQQHA